MMVVACPSSSARRGIKKENYILSGRATELSEGRNFTVLGEVELDRADELICSSYI